MLPRFKHRDTRGWRYWQVNIGPIHLDSSAFQDGNLHIAYMHMHSFHIRDGGPVEAVFIVSMDLIVLQTGRVAGC